MKNGKSKNLIGRIMIVCLSAFALAACGAADKWRGETYSGKITINDVEPNNASPHKFTLVSNKVPGGRQKFVTLDKENKTLGNCTIPLKDEISTDNYELQAGPFFVPDKSGAVCDSIVEGNVVKVLIHSGTVTVSSDPADNRVKVSILGILAADSKSYSFDFDAERQK